MILSAGFPAARLQRVASRARPLPPRAAAAHAPPRLAPPPPRRSRVHSNAPDAEEARRQVEQVHETMNTYIALISVSSPKIQIALSQVLLSRLDTPNSADDGAAGAIGGGAGPAGAAAAAGAAPACAGAAQQLPTQQHLDWAISQLHLEPSQVGVRSLCCRGAEPWALRWAGLAGGSAARAACSGCRREPRRADERARLLLSQPRAWPRGSSCASHAPHAHAPRPHAC